MQPAKPAKRQHLELMTATKTRNRRKSASSAVQEPPELVKDGTRRWIDQGVASLSRGEGIDGEEALRQLDARHEAVRHELRE